jgi:hypothetical protein
MRTNPNSRLRRWLLAGAAIVALPLTTAGWCDDPTSIRLLQPNAERSVFIDGWEQANEAGDEALVEQKQSGMWVIPLNAEYRNNKTGEFTVEIRLDPAKGFIIVNMNGVKTGKDHDNCLAEDELYALPLDEAVANAMKNNMETDKGPSDDSNDDCLLTSDTKALGTTFRSDYRLVA